MRGNRTRKLHSMLYQAFDSPGEHTARTRTQTHTHTHTHKQTLCSLTVFVLRQQADMLCVCVCVCVCCRSAGYPYLAQLGIDVVRDHIHHS